MYSRDIRGLDMPRAFLHPDLVRSIAEHLQDDTHTLASLCLVDKEALNSVAPLLYKTIHLSAVRSISGFCDTIMQSDRNLGIYPTSILFVPLENHADKELYPVVELIQNILPHVPNVTDLALGIDTPNLIELHRYLQHHSVPFSLHRLACHFTPDLMPFLSAQSSIRTLLLYPPYDMPAHPCIIASPPPSSVLPYLKSTITDVYTAISLLPGRPVSHVHVPVLFELLVHRFYQCLRESSAPEGVETLSVGLPGRSFWMDVLGFVASLGETFETSLKVLEVRTIVMPGIQMEKVSWPLFVRRRLLTVEH